jgi:hypothetical protein
MNKYKRIEFGVYTLEVEPIRTGSSKQRVIAHPTKLAKSNGGYAYETNLYELLDKRTIKECNRNGIKVNKTHFVLNEASSVEPELVSVVMDAFKRRLPETIQWA